MASSSGYMYYISANKIDSIIDELDLSGEQEIIVNDVMTKYCKYEPFCEKYFIDFFAQLLERFYGRYHPHYALSIYPKLSDDSNTYRLVVTDFAIRVVPLSI